MSSTILVLCMRCLLYDPNHGLSFFLSMSTSLTKNIFHFPQHNKHFNFLQIHIYHRILGKKTVLFVFLFLVTNNFISGDNAPLNIEKS